MSDQNLVAVPEELAESVRQLFGDRFDLAEKFAAYLAAEGELRGLIGPRELPRLWDRHLVNSAVLGELIPPSTRVMDVGSGAGFPGLVLAIARPDLELVLVEPMMRRVTWLEDAVAHCELTNVTVVRGRAGDGSLDVDLAPVVTARAVAPLSKLWGWCRPLVATGGSLIALKGRSAQEELEASLPLKRAGDTAVRELWVEGMSEPTYAVTVKRAR